MMPIRVYHNPDFLTFYQAQTLDLGRLYLAAIVATDEPETAYRLTQHVETWYGNPGVTTVVRSRSTSVGDVLALADGRLLLVASFGFEPLADAVLPADGSALMRRLQAAISALAGSENREAASALEATARQLRALYTALLFALPLLACAEHAEAMAGGGKVKPYQALLARFASEQARWALAQADGGE